MKVAPLLITTRFAAGTKISPEANKGMFAGSSAPLMCAAFIGLAFVSLAAGQVCRVWSGKQHGLF